MAYFGIEKSSTTGAAKTITYEHHEVHGGSFYHAFYQLDLGNGATQDMLIVTPDTTKWGHFTWSVITELEATVYFYEGTTTSADGTSLTVFNRNRNSANTAGITAFHTPTVTGAGTALDTVVAGSGRTAGGNTRATNEWILDQNNKYMLRVTNNTANNNQVSMIVNWYEHTDR